MPEIWQTVTMSVTFSAVHAAKDSGIALKLAESEGLTFPLAKATFEQYNRLVELGKGELDKSAIAELTFRGRSYEVHLLSRLFDTKLTILPDMP